MSSWTTIADLRLYLDQVEAGSEQDATLQAVLDRAEAIIARYLTGVVIELPAPDDLIQIVLELASSLWLTKGTPARLGSAGVDGEGGYSYTGGLTPEQRAALRQIRIELQGVAL